MKKRMLTTASAINLGTLQVDGNDKSFYQVIAPADVRGAITQNDSTFTAATVDSVESDTTKTVFTYGDTIVVKVVGAIPQGGERAVCGTKNDCPSLWGSCAGH